MSRSSRFLFAPVIALALAAFQSSPAEAAGPGPLIALAPPAPGVEPDTFFGNAIAMDNDTAFVSATETAAGGTVYVFVRDGALWRPHPATPQLSVTAPGLVADDQFGTALALSGTTLIVGAPGRAQGKGSVYVFRRSGAVSSAWLQSGDPVVASGLDNEDSFGVAVALSGDTAVIGAPNDDNDQSSISDVGAAYVYLRTGTSPDVWTLQKKITPAVPGGQTLIASGRFGSSVGVSGDAALVGALGQLTSGGTGFANVTSFLRTGTTWSSGTALAPLGPNPDDDAFGLAIAMAGNRALVGAPHANSFAGVVDAYELVGTSWVGRGEFASPNSVSDGQFGNAIAIAGTRAAVAASQENDGFGQGYLYALPPSCSGASCVWGVDGGAWSPAGSLRGFGRSIALSANAVMGGDDNNEAFFGSLGARTTPVLGVSGLSALGVLLGVCSAVALRRRRSA